MKLSKSLYTRGLQCQKSLWLKKHKKEVLTPPNSSAQAIFENGNEVVYSVINNFCYDISNYIDDNMEDENENEENINALLNYIKNEYNYFGEFDRVIIDKLMEEILED